MRIKLIDNFLFLLFTETSRSDTCAVSKDNQCVNLRLTLTLLAYTIHVPLFIIWLAHKKIFLLLPLFRFHVFRPKYATMDIAKLVKLFHHLLFHNIEIVNKLIDDNYFDNYFALLHPSNLNKIKVNSSWIYIFFHFVRSPYADTPYWFRSGPYPWSFTSRGRGCCDPPNGTDGSSR